ncbi:DUF7346 family protein [Halobacterium zhouii]|uniref:DUF7346 family protein n=1 Tax=Halobacterium zhouii TaxID=2902624 RepID=UPI001E49BA5B|nr:hypothetical protein [Halobacterium zhouii]
MRTVRDDDTVYVVLKESADSTLVRDPATGEERHLPTDSLEPAGGTAPLDALATAIPEDARAVVRACHADWHLGVLVALADDGPLPARSLVARFETCESDLVGALTEFRAAELVEETDVHGERGYRLTDAGESGIGALRD